MTAPILPLDASNLASEKNLGIVGAWMLWPTDGEWRKRYFSTLAVEDVLSRLPSTMSRGPITALVSLARAAASPDEIAGEWAKRSPRGMGAGRIVYDAMKEVILDPSAKAPVGKATEAVRTAIYGAKNSNSKHINEDVVKTYRPVAALWAAYIYFDDGGEDGAPFPCCPEDLPQFLGFAEDFRELAERTKPKHRGQPIIPRGVSVRLPDDVLAILPRGTLTVQV
ncbi:hypothetical protein [Parvibaculum sp.]|uniref:hypothetical protein n=1 Tax=Parvibaculum sp. TaxID=2024848 RepID=UPI00320DB96D